MNTSMKSALLAGLAAILSSCTTASSDTPAMAVSTAAAGDPLAQPAAGEWPSDGRDYTAQRYSPLTQIDASNVSQLGLAWFDDLDTYRGVEATPIYADGVLYNTLPWNITTAYDARTGAELWTYDPQTPREFGRLACCEPVSRGLAMHGDTIVIATLDGRLIALDKDSGAEIWTNRTFELDSGFAYSITGAPRVYDGKVVIGNGGADYGVRGFVVAYDAETGEQLWKFYTVPGNPADGPDGEASDSAMEIALPTWHGEWWRYGGGGTAWDSFAYDPELNLVYIGTGNGSPHMWYQRSEAKGDNLFLCSIVAVDADTGDYAWYYQMVPEEEWDYTCTQPMILTDLEIEGEERQVMMQAPKNGFFYVLDRATGELRAHPYTDGITWATHVDMETGRPVENPDVVYEKKPQWILPANAGAHNWEPQSWDEKQGIMYFYYHDLPAFYSLDEGFVETGEYKIRERGLSLGWGEGDYRRQLIEKADPPPPTEGYVGAFDPISGKYKWRHQLQYAFNGGVLATAAGLLFQGEGDGRLVARDTDTGEPIWEYDALGRFSSSVISYQINEVQYLATMVGGLRAIDLGGTLLVFKLGGTAQIPVTEVLTEDVPLQPEIDFDLDQFLAGEQIYDRQCASCHGGIGVPSEVLTTAPDLRTMSSEVHAEFSSIVLRGTLAEQGMAGFADVLDESDVQALRQFLIREANALRMSIEQSSPPSDVDNG